MRHLKLWEKLSRYHLPILTGIFVGTSYIPFPPWAIFFCYVPLFLFWLSASSLRQVFLGGWISQFILTLIGFNWIAHTMTEFGHLPWPVAILLLIIFCLFANLFVPLTGVIWFVLQQQLKLNTVQKTLLLCCLLTLAEAYFPAIFPWNLGYTWLWAEFPAYQLADVIGFQGLSAITLFINGILLLAWVATSPTLKWKWVVLALSLLASLNIAGYFWIQRLPKPDQTFTVNLVQANISNIDKLYAELGHQFRGKIIQQYFTWTQKGLNSTTKTVDFSIWPETAFPSYLNSQFQYTPYSRQLQSFVNETKTPLVTGAYFKDINTQQTGNGFYMLDADGNVLDEIYIKTHLLAFGEYFPGRTWSPALDRWVHEMIPAMADFAKGPGPVTMQLNGLRIGPQICYEGLFPYFSKGLADSGAQVMINLTNDSWYGTWQEPYQHLYMTLARAIEFRRPLVRATNTGFTTTISARGKISDISPLYESWFNVVEVPYYSKPLTTFYQRYIYLLEAIIGTMLAMLIFIGLKQKELFKKTNSWTQSD